MDQAVTDADDRVVHLVEEDVPVDDVALFPDQTGDDTDRGWGEPRDDRDAWLLEERPPHYS